MIVQPQGDQLLVVTQNDHAHFSGELLSLWHRSPFPDHPRRETLLFAAREHDNGWREADSAPRRDPATGRPHTFITMPEAQRRDIWSRGVQRFVGTHPEASLLILQHALHLYRHHATDPHWASTIKEWRGLEAELMSTLDVGREELDADYPWIDLSDHLSLAFCNGWKDPISSRGFRFRVGDGLQIDPFPLAGATTFRLPCRYIPARSYVSDSDLGAELATARWTNLSVQVAPFTDEG